MYSRSLRDKFNKKIMGADYIFPVHFPYQIGINYKYTYRTFLTMDFNDTLKFFKYHNILNTSN